MYCPNCGKEIHEGSIYCLYCGKKVLKKAEKENSISSYYFNTNFKEICEFLMNFTGVEIKLFKVMVKFSTYTNKSKINKPIGLAWPWYPKNADSFRINLRNIGFVKYPEELTNKISDYRVQDKDQPFAGFPIYTIKNESDVMVTKELIKLAY